MSNNDSSFETVGTSRFWSKNRFLISQLVSAIPVSKIPKVHWVVTLILAALGAMLSVARAENVRRAGWPSTVEFQGRVMLNAHCGQAGDEKGTCSHAQPPAAPRCNKANQAS
jgi:hypothetical protein